MISRGSVVLMSGREVEWSELSRFNGLSTGGFVVGNSCGGGRAPLLPPPPPLLRARGYALLLVCR